MGNKLLKNSMNCTAFICLGSPISIDSSCTNEDRAIGDPQSPSGTLISSLHISLLPRRK